jgi:pimeloyl-ACP methyl ester carboxylesterase
VRAFLADHPIDRERVWIAGEGVGAALAFDLALRAPGLFRGIVIEQGPLFPSTGVERAHRAAAVGLRVGAVLDDSRDLPWLSDERDVPGAAQELARWLAEAGFGERSRVAPVRSQTEARAQVAAFLRSWSP